MLRRRHSSSYAAAVAARYWSTALATHEDMSREYFAFYHKEIKKLIQPTLGHKFLDYRCGGGGITVLLKSEGFDVEACDISATLVESAKQRGVRACLCEELHQARQNHYDTIIFNNAFLRSPESMGDVTSSFAVHA